MLIRFDERGFCEHCNNILPNWHPDEIGKKQLDEIIKKIKQDGKGQKHDCIVGLSGGAASSYLVYYAKKVMGLRLLIFSVDTGWSLNVAVENIEIIVKGS